MGSQVLQNYSSMDRDCHRDDYFWQVGFGTGLIGWQNYPCNVCWVRLPASDVFILLEASVVLLSSTVVLVDSDFFVVTCSAVDDSDRNVCYRSDCGYRYLLLADEEFAYNILTSRSVAAQVVL